MTRFALLPPALQCFFRYWTQRKTVVAALGVAILSGSALAIGLQYDVFLSGQIPSYLFVKIIFTSAVLYLAASYSAARADMGKEPE